MGIEKECKRIRYIISLLSKGEFIILLYTQITVHGHDCFFQVNSRPTNCRSVSYQYEGLKRKRIHRIYYIKFVLTYIYIINYQYFRFFTHLPPYLESSLIERIMVITRRSDSAEHSRSTPFLQSVPTTEFETHPLTPYHTPIRPLEAKIVVLELQAGES